MKRRSRWIHPYNDHAGGRPNLDPDGIRRKNHEATRAHGFGDRDQGAQSPAGVQDRAPPTPEAPGRSYRAYITNVMALAAAYS